jgi:thiol:disulfide interchange protein
MRSTQPLYAGLLLALLGFGCRAERVEVGSTQSPEARSASAPVETNAHLAWGNAVTWQSWDSAQSLARKEGKAICLVVYANWCSHCKELAPVFAQPEVASAARELVMVHQDQDENPEWLTERFGAYGTSVPRVFFVAADGKVREDLTSGHPRYPYFYAPMVTDQLVANMRAASTAAAHPMIPTSNHGP